MHTLIPPTTTAPKSDKPQYCNKNVATPKATKFNYQPRVRRKYVSALYVKHTMCPSFVDLM